MLSFLMFFSIGGCFYLYRDVFAPSRSAPDRGGPYPVGVHVPMVRRVGRDRDSRRVLFFWLAFAAGRCDWLKTHVDISYGLYRLWLADAEAAAVAIATNAADHWNMHANRIRAPRSGAEREGATRRGKGRSSRRSKEHQKTEHPRGARTCRTGGRGSRASCATL